MTFYSNINDAFNITEYDELDKMAREYNNKCNNNYFNKDTKNNDKNNSIQDQSNKFNFFSTQGNLTNQSSTFDYNSESNNSDKFIFDITDKSSNKINFEQESKDSFMTSLNDNKKYNYSEKYNDNLCKLVNIIKSSHIEDSSSSDNINDAIDHIKVCYKCRKNFKTLINNNNNKNNKNNKINKNNDYNYDNNDHIFFNKKNTVENDNKLIVENFNNPNNSFNILESDIKNIIITILVGIGIIFILDIFWRSNTH